MSRQARMLRRFLPSAFFTVSVLRNGTLATVQRVLYLSIRYSLNFEISSANAPKSSSETFVRSPFIRLFGTLPSL